MGFRNNQQLFEFSLSAQRGVHIAEIFDNGPAIVVHREPVRTFRVQGGQFPANQIPSCHEDIHGAIDSQIPYRALPARHCMPLPKPRRLLARKL